MSAAKQSLTSIACHSGPGIVSESDASDWPLDWAWVATDFQLRDLLEHIDAADQVALDIEADSLHSYREKLCLLQISVSAPCAGAAVAAQQRNTGTQRRLEQLKARHFIVDPLSGLDLEPLRRSLEKKELVLHGADYDLRMLRRGLNLAASRIFDTMIAARLLGIREFGLAALVKRYFGVALPKGSQKANWARRPLSAQMASYAINDVRYLLPLAEKMTVELVQLGRLDWLLQSCQRAIEQSAVSRVRAPDELWRIPGSGALRRRAAAVLRALWHWRENEAERVDRPPFHILQNHELLDAAAKFASGGAPDYKHFSARRRRAFHEAARGALELPESQWPAFPQRGGRRHSAETLRRAEALRRQRDRSAERLGLEPSFIAARSALEAVAADDARALELLLPWQRELLGINRRTSQGGEVPPHLPRE